MDILSQRDPRWKNIKLGTSGETIGDYGCTVTCLAMILGTTPDVVNDRINFVQGYASGDLVIWAKLEEAFPGIKVKRVWTYDNADVKANTPNVLVEVDGKPIGGIRHWVVFIGNRKLYDPWTGKERPTSDFPDPLSYCVIGGKWNKPSPAPDLQAELDQTRIDRDRNWNYFAGLCDVMKVPAVYETAKSELEKLVGIEDKYNTTAGELTDAQKQITDLEAQLKTLTDSHNALLASQSNLQGQIDKDTQTIQGLTKDLADLKAQVNKPLPTGLKKALIDWLLSF